MGTIKTGNAAEAAVLSQLTERGFQVLVPFGDGTPFDLAVDLGGARMLRVQCKAAWFKGGCVEFNSRSTDHGRGERSYKGLADVLGVWCGELQRAYLVPVDDAPASRAYLRVTPTRNNQRRRVRHARDYELPRWSRADLVGLLPAVGCATAEQLPRLSA